MLKYILFVLCICVLFFGCTDSKNNTKNTVVNDKTEIEIDNNKHSDDVMRKNELFNHPEYSEYFKSFTIFYESNLIDLKKFPENIRSKHIEQLKIRCDLTDINFLENFLQLKLLVLQIGKKIDNIEILKKLNNLEHLTIDKMRRNIDLSPISNLKNLKFLIFTYSEINDLSSISCLENLEYLYFLNSEIENMKPIYDLISLKHLTLNYQENHNLTDIGKLQNLEYLMIPYLTQENLNLLMDLKQLRELETTNFIGNDVSPLLKLPNLEKLQINYDNSIDYLPLAKSNSLKKIWFTSWDSYDVWSDFYENKRIIFEENGIYTPLSAKDWE